MDRNTNRSSVVFAQIALIASGCLTGCFGAPDEGEVGQDPEELMAQDDVACQGRTFAGDFVVETAADIMALAPYSIVTGRVTVTGTRLESLEGLECLSEVGSLHIVDNDALASIEGLGSLTRVRGDLRVRGNRAMTDVDGLGSVTHVDGDLAIDGNGALEQVDGLISVDIIGGSMEITDNDAMTSAAGLDGVWSVGRSLIIAENDAMAELEMGILFGVGRQMVIADNPQLPTCVAQRLADQVRVSEFSTATEYEVSGNDDEAVCQWEQ